MKFSKIAATLCAAAVLPLASGIAVAADKVRTNSMPYYTGFPIYAADKLGLYKKYDIDTEPKYFPSGAPIIQAAAAKQWDITFLGAPPATLAGPKLGLITIGFVTEEAGIHQLIGRPDGVAAVKKDPMAIKGKKIFVTTVSTGHYMTEGCLRKMGVKLDEVTILPSEQTATLSAFAAGEGDFAQAWPPQGDALLSKGNEVLCDGIQAGLSIPSVWIVAPHFLEKNPDAVVRWLKATSEAVDWIKADKARATELYKKFEQFRGFDLDPKVLAKEIDVMFNDLATADEMIEKMTAKGGEKSYLAKGYEGVAGFFKRVGRMDSIPDYEKLIDPSFLKKATAK
jgi:sulfonate transport system substrate-binding protein